MPGVTFDNQDFNRQISQVMRNLDRVVIDFSKRDRQKITRSAAQPVAREARKTTAFEDSKRIHRRKVGTRTIEYLPGNLRRSLKVISLRRTGDAYVGPQFAKKKVNVYGGVGGALDGYYAAMVFGSAIAFRRRVLEPGLNKGASKALKILRIKSRKAINSRGVSRGFKLSR